MAMTISSPVFRHEGAIPARHTCESDDVSPPLMLGGVPTAAKSLALIVDDPDAPDPAAPKRVWVHWVLYDLPATWSELSEDLPKGQHLPTGAKHGLNDFKHLGYGGPCPPPGKPHRYFFKLYALDAFLDLKPGATKTKSEERRKR